MVVQCPLVDITDFNSNEEVMNMDLAVMKKLNRQGLVFVGIHSLFILNFAFELMLLK